MMIRQIPSQWAPVRNDTGLFEVKNSPWPHQINLNKQRNCMCEFITPVSQIDDLPASNDMLLAPSVNYGIKKKKKSQVGPLQKLPPASVPSAHTKLCRLFVFSNELINGTSDHRARDCLRRPREHSDLHFHEPRANRNSPSGAAGATGVRGKKSSGR
jgi:hypothetical protein